MLIVNIIILMMAVGERSMQTPAFQQNFNANREYYIAKLSAASTACQT